MVEKNNRYRIYVLGALTSVCTLNYVDRGLIGLLLQPIKEDLNLSDTQLGFLTGIAFGLFYATLGLPIARWADRGNRVTIISIAIGLWSATVMSCMLVTNFVQLVAARIAAAVGEAGCFPTAYSLLGDYFPAPADRTRAMAVFMLATPLSSLLGYIVGGWLNEHYGWRYAFFLIGLPGLVLVLLIRLTVKEPRAARPGAMNRTQSAPPLATVVSVLWRQRSSRHLSIALILLYLMALGLAPWYAAFMVRSHGMETTELGIWLGLLFGIGGSVGTVLGGYLAARWFPDDARGQMRLSAIMIAAVVPCFFLFLLLPAKRDALLALLPLLIILHIFIGPTFALMQRLVADEIRASTLAVVLLLANLIGMGIGPQAVGILSDLLGERFGSDSLRYAMLGMSFIALWSAFHFWQVGETADADLGQVPAIQRT